MILGAVGKISVNIDVLDRLDNPIRVARATSDGDETRPIIGGMSLMVPTEPADFVPKFIVVPSESRLRIQGVADSPPITNGAFTVGFFALVTPPVRSFDLDRPVDVTTP